MVGQLNVGVFPIVRASQAERAAERSRISGPGDPDRWAAAVAAWEAAADPSVAAYARWRGPRRLGVGGPRERAVTLARATQQVAIELGARPLREQVESLAHRARINRGLSDPPLAPALARYERSRSAPGVRRAAG